MIIAINKISWSLIQKLPQLFRGTNLALRWITKYSRERAGKSMAIKLANELIDAANETGNSIRKREEIHRMAEANKAFASYRF